MGNLKERYLDPVTTFGNTQEANRAITNCPSGYPYLKSGRTERIRTTDSLLAKSRFFDEKKIPTPVSSGQMLINLQVDDKPLWKR